ncbi:putative ribosomal protein in infB 5'region [Lentibacillus sp. JNUCC-1]|uniref:L7Ae/L30e/S12e/Gadd45 family ribosomal protein n=1 Tax=Lentibacillus sp. JNUCC-1 TaxID=2654513 RepID=UPI0012E92DEF|nr:ribosomal L7Ae/L30e/S12e/Gadd45 family protein [Lentibacillus sp. JNUCC-1]MUV39921.1 putative ribosomal protein in infB 5'region [Lentibacillus sp. JNUCC-1]
MNSKYLNLLGLAFRAGKCSLGEEVIVKDIQRQHAKLVLIASDTGQRTRKKLLDKCKTYNIPAIIVDDRDTLSHAIGKSQRVAIAILDKGFASKLETLLSDK